MSKKTIYIVICRNSNGSYVYQKRFSTKLDADKFIMSEKEDDKCHHRCTQYSYNLYIRGVDITDLS